MNRRWLPRHGLLALLALLPIACGRVQGEQDVQVLPPYELSAEEVRVARELAERDLVRPQNPQSLGDKIVFTKVELLPDSRANTTQRLVTVAHYRYRGDEAVLTTVDLNTRQVLSVDTVPHFPTPLAQEELACTLELARADARLADLWTSNAGSDFHVEAKVGYSPAGDPLFGRRTVYLLFRVGANYLTGPRVVVDLTSETVSVEPVARTAAK